LSSTAYPAARRTLALCLLAACCEGIDLQSAGLAAGRLAAQLHLNANALTLFFSASTLGLVLGATIGGRISDLVGRKRGLLAALALFGAASIGTALAAQLPALLLARLGCGLGMGTAMPNLVALSAEAHPPGQRSRAIAMTYAGMPVGGAGVSALMLAGSLNANWRTVFYIGGVLPLLLLPLLGVYLPESAEYRAAKGALSDGAHAKSASIWALLGNLFGRATILTTMLVWLSYFFSMLVVYLLINWLPLLLVGRGLSRDASSLVQIWFNVGGALGIVLAGVLMDRGWRWQAVALSAATQALTLWVLSSVAASVAQTALMGFFMGAAVLSAPGILYAMMIQFYPVRIRTGGVGAAIAAGRVGSLLGPLLAGALVARGTTPAQILLDLIPAALISAAASFGLLFRPSVAN